MQTYFLTLLLALNVYVGAQTTAEPPAQTRSTLRVDIRQFGHERLQHKTARPARLAIDFSDSKHVAVAWVRPDARSKNDAPRFGQPANLRVVVFEVSTGHRETQKDWATPYQPSPFLIGIPDGNFLICTDDSLRLLSASLETLLTRDIPKHGSCRSTIIRFSPSRRTLLLIVLEQGKRDMQLLNSSTLAVISSWTEEGKCRTETVSDNSLVGYCGEPQQICIRPFDREEWQPLPRDILDTQMSKGHPLPVSFIADRILAIGSRVTSIVTVDGQILFRIAMPRDSYPLPPVASAESETLVVKEERLRGLKSEPLDLYPFQSDYRAIVYRIGNDQAVLSVPLKGTSPWSPWRIHDNAPALSPDGMSLALASDEVLEVYPLPKNQ